MGTGGGSSNLTPTPYPPTPAEAAAVTAGHRQAGTQLLPWSRCHLARLAYLPSAARQPQSHFLGVRPEMPEWKNKVHFLLVS